MGVILAGLGSVLLGASALAFVARPKFRPSAVGGMLVGLGGVVASWSRLTTGRANTLQDAAGVLLIVAGVGIAVMAMQRH